MVEAVNLIGRFDDIVAVDHISTAIRDGSVFRLIGTNGARRSTFLRLASSVLKPDEGCIAIDGHGVFKNTPAKKRSFYISDEQYFFSNTTPEEIMRHYRRVCQRFDEARFRKLVGNFSLGEKRKIHTFSKDMKKQVSAICGVYTDTDYLFRDETFDGLDPVIHQAVKNIFTADMKDRNLAPIIASHNPRELEDMCDHVGLPYKGDTLLSRNLDDMRPNIHKIQCVLEPDVKPENLTSPDKVNVKQRGSLCTITARGSRDEVGAVIASYEPIFFECIPLSLEKIFISEAEVVSYDIRKFIL